MQSHWNREIVNKEFIDLNPDPTNTFNVFFFPSHFAPFQGREIVQFHVLLGRSRDHTFQDIVLPKTRQFNTFSLNQKLTTLEKFLKDATRLLQ